MSLLNAIQSMLPRPDNRSRDEIARDLDDEFAFHLEMKARAIESEEGVDREAASGMARAQFGDIERIRNQCRRIALKEQIMLQRVNFIMMIIVTLLVIGVGVQVMFTQRYNTLALQAITADLAKMKFEATTVAHGSNTAGSNGAASSPMDVGESRVLVEGDVPGFGWHAIDMNRGTLIGDLMKEIGATNDLWVEYQSKGDKTNYSAIPVPTFLATKARKILRPDDELRFTKDEDVPADRKCRHLIWISEQDGLGLWRQVDAAGSIVANGWSLRAREQNAAELPGSGPEMAMVHFELVRESGIPSNLNGAFTPNSMSIRSENPPASNSYSMQWGYEGGQIVMDFSTLRLDERLAGDAPELDLKSTLGDQGRVTFARAKSPMASADTERRAKAVGDFVVRLFALADPNDPHLEQTIRNFLDAEEKSVDQKYAADPATAAMIRELIAARRKIFDADAGFRAAATAEEKTRAVTEFLSDMLANAEPQVHSQVAVEKILQQASLKAEDLAADNPELAATLRERIAEAKKHVGAETAPSTSPAAPGVMTDAELQAFIPRLMTASIPNSAESNLPTLDELDRAAAAIDAYYAKDPTLLNKLHGMVATVRQRLDTKPPAAEDSTPDH